MGRILELLALPALGGAVLAAYVLVVLFYAMVLYVVWNYILRDVLVEQKLGAMSYLQAIGTAWLLIVFFKPVIMQRNSVYVGSAAVRNA